MKKILITGSSGFLGRHLINSLKNNSSFEVFIVDKKFKIIYPFEPINIDVVFHFASTHREKNEEDVYKINMQINKELTRFLALKNYKADIIFTSSVQEEKNNFYGKSKLNGHKYLKEQNSLINKNVIKFVLPNLFGPYAKVNHTSVVANFCYNIINKKKSIINETAIIDLCYVKDAVTNILELDSQLIFPTTKIKIKDLYIKIESIYNMILNNNIILKNRFETNLFVTIKSYMV